MKNLKQYIDENISLKEGLRLGINKYIPVMNESLRIGINDSPYTASPTTWDELRQIVEERYEELGPGKENNVIDFNDIDVSEIDTFFNDPSDVGLFEGAPFEYIDISDWDVSNVKHMSNTFFDCRILKSVGDISKWDVSNVKDMWGMFYECENLKSVGDISKWNTINVEHMGDMFTNSGIINIPDWYEE